MGAVNQYHHGFYMIAFPPRSTPTSVRPSLTLYVIHVIHTAVLLCRTGENLIGLLNLIMPTAFVVCRPVSCVSLCTELILCPLCIVTIFCGHSYTMLALVVVQICEL